MSRRPTRRAHSARRGKRGRLRRRLVAWLARVLLAWVIVTALVVLALRWLDPPTSAFMLNARLSGDSVQNQWLDWADIPPRLALAVVAAEDQRFPTHHGFDFVEIRNAVETAIRGGRVRGASTISQQLAKNLFLWPGRNILRKGLEAWFTVLLELSWPKRRILEVYLNIAQFGDGVYGVAAASRQYFGKPPAALSRYQMSLLASVLPSPAVFRPDAPGEVLRERAAFVRKHMQRLGGTAYLSGL